MLSLAQAEASDLLSCTMPPLLALYAAAKPAPNSEVMEPVLMILPPPTAISAGYAALLHKKALVRLVSITVFHSSSV